jgi:hypothetical protein
MAGGAYGHTMVHNLISTFSGCRFRDGTKPCRLTGQLAPPDMQTGRPSQRGLGAKFAVRHGVPRPAIRLLKERACRRAERACVTR